MDIVEAGTRSRMMAGIRGRDTKPERVLRSALHRRGFRFRLHDGRLPGRPDIVLPRYHVVVLVHGCFWHRHVGCKYAAEPATRPDFWASKFAANVARDARDLRQLRDQGWRVAIIWACGLGPGQFDHLVARLVAFVSGDEAELVLPVSATEMN